MQIFSLLSICQYSGIRSVCSTAKVMIVSDNIASIPQREFYKWTNLVNVTFTQYSSLTAINANAFQGCTKITSFTFPPNLLIIGDYAFASCSSLVEINLPASLTTIGQYGFSSCTKLTSIIADDNIQVTSLEAGVFEYCGIASFVIWKSLTDIHGSSFRECSKLSDFTNPFDNENFCFDSGVLYCGTALNFMSMTMTGNFVIPSWVTSIMSSSCRSNAFDYISFEPGSQMTTFGGSSFLGSKFTTFEFPDSTLVTEIAGAMFNNCANLVQLTIPPNIKSIGINAFVGSGLAYIDVAEDHPSFSSVDGIVYSRDQSSIIVCPPRFIVDVYEIPKTVTSIAMNAFRSSRIKEFVFEEGSQLKSIQQAAFFSILQTTFSFDVDCPLDFLPNLCFGSSNLETILLPKTLVSIDGGAFSSTKLSAFLIPDDAKHLVSIDGVLYSKDNTILFRFPPRKIGNDYEVPSSVQQIGSSAFATCSGIQTLSFERGSNLETVKKSAFASSSIVTVVFDDDSNDVTFESGCFESSSVQYVTLPGKMKTIKRDLFKDCFDLVGITLPESATTIETGAFTNCESLAKLTIPPFCQIRNIPLGAFTNTRSLTELQLPYLIETIAADSLPSTLETLTIWGKLWPSVVSAISTIPTLQDIHIMCGLSLNTTQFVSQDIRVHYICFTKRLGPGSFLKFIHALLVMSHFND